MVAKRVNGRDVLTVQDVHTPLSRPDRPVIYTSLKELLLDDETTVFGCVETEECEYAHERLGKVRQHINREHRRQEPRATERARGGLSVTLDEDLANLPFGDVLKRLTRRQQHVTELERQLGKVMDDREVWKSRALAAEKKLATLRSALQGGK